MASSSSSCSPPSSSSRPSSHPPRRTIITLLRHGETTHNRLRIIQGHLDIPLNDNGIEQAKFIARYLAEREGGGFDQAWSSDLGRARVTGEIVVEEMGRKGMVVGLGIDRRIRERFLGELQGKVVKTLEERNRLSGTIEPTKVIQARLFEFWDMLLPPSNSHSDDDTSLPPKRILLVSHGGAIRALIQGLLTMRSSHYTLDPSQDLSGRLGNCSITEIEVEFDGGWKGVVRKYGDESCFTEVGSSRVPSPSVNVDIVE